MQLSFKVIAASSLISAAGILGVANAQTDTVSPGPMTTTGHRNDSATTMSGNAGAHPKTAMKHPKSKLVAQKTCPVMGSPIDKSIYADYKDKRVYFCCAMCPETFNKDPEKYLKVLADRGEAVEDAPKK
jgi:YHS domain-containing protein